MRKTIKEYTEIFTWISTKIQNIPVLFTSDIFNKNTIPSDMYLYEVGFNEKTFTYNIVTSKHAANKIGTLLAFKPINLNAESIYICDKDSDFAIKPSDDFMSFAEFVLKHKDH